MTFYGVLLYFQFHLLSAEEEHHDLCCEDAQEHRERIYRRITQRRCLFRADAVRVGQGRGVGVCTGYHTCNGEVVELEPDAGNRSDNQDGDNRDEETRQHIDISRNIMLADVVV